MSNVIKNPRSGCALHGALQTVQEVNGLVPIIHANAGCGVINYLANKDKSSGQTRISGLSIPGTAAQERHVIFGGASRLREQIKNTIKVINGDLYVILNSCESATVGDDVDAMTREIVEQGEPVVDTLIAGFNGGIHYGYEHVLADILKAIDSVKVSQSDKDPKLVNVFGLVPGQDPYLQGNLDELKRILEAVGLKANLFFGADGGVEDLVNAKNAALSIVFSRWGELPAKLLKEQYQIPYIQRQSLPIGAEGIESLLNEVGKIISLDEENVGSFVEREKAYEQRLIFRVRDRIFEYGLSKAVIVGTEEEVIRIGSFLDNILGVEIISAILTDSLKKDDEHDADNSDILYQIAANVYIASDQKEIDDIIRSSKAEIVFGTSLEEGIARKLAIPLVKISGPIFNKVILNRASIGTRGEISLIEEYITRIVEFDEVKNKKLAYFVKGEEGGKTWQELSQKTNYTKHSNSITELPTREYISALK